MITRWRVILAALFAAYVTHLAVGYMSIRALTTDYLVDVAIGYTETSTYMVPRMLQRRAAERILATRDLAAFGVRSDGAVLSLSLPLGIAHHKYSINDLTQAKINERHRAMRVAGLLYKRGVNLEAVDSGGCSPLQAMALAGDSEFYEFLVSLGADEDFQNVEARVTTCRRSAREILVVGPQ